MSKAFVKESESDDELEQEVAPPLPPSGKNYITPAGYARLEAELRRLVEVERPEVVNTVAWAASHGDRSENGDYIYGKRRLREIDRRVRFLIKRLESAEIVNSSGRDTDQVFFGATVRVKGAAGEKTVTIVGVDEVDPRARPRFVGLADRQGAAQGARGRPGDAAHARGRRETRNPGGDLPMSIIKEFREFAVKGNVIDLAVGVVIGAAFGKIVASVVEDIVMPLIGAHRPRRLQGPDVAGRRGEDPVRQVPADLPRLHDHRARGSSSWSSSSTELRRDEDQPPAATPPRQEQLLEEIRDLLKQRR